MENYRWVWVLLKWLLLLGAPLLLLAMFTMQNLSRTTGLSMNLGVGAVELDHAWPVPCLMAVTFLLGFFIGEVHARISSWRGTGSSFDSAPSLKRSEDDWV